MTRFFSLLSFTLILLLAYWLRVFEANHIPPGMHFDEATEIQRAWRIAAGYGLPLYFVEAPEPFDAFYRGVFGYFVGIDRITQRYTQVYLSVLSVAAVMGAARALSRKRHLVGAFRETPLQQTIIMLVAGLALAVMPPSVMIGRTVYRANWVAPMTLLALLWLAWAWNTRKTRCYVLTGIFTALGTLFYPAGILFPPTIIGLMILAALADRRTLPHWRGLIGMALAFFVTMLPWIYLYLRIPNWLTLRLDDLSNAGLPIIGNPTAFLEQLWLSVRLIFAPPLLREPVYNALSLNTTNTAFLNPPLLVLFVIGVVLALRGFLTREPRAFAPLVLAAGMILPGALTTTPEEAIRFIGMFGALAILTGMGAGAVVQSMVRFRRGKACLAPTNKTTDFRVYSVYILIVILVLFSAGYTWWHVRDHYLNWRGDDAKYFTRLQRQMEYIIATEQPIYLPLEYLNYRLTASYLRPTAFPHLRAYGGATLPAGELFYPFDATYGSPFVSRPYTAYVLLLPETGETVILPPLPEEDIAALETRAQAEGTLLVDELGRELGYTLAISAENNPFENVLYRDFSNAESIAVFDDNLEVLAVDAPQTLTPGEFVRVTLYWRLRHVPAADYFMMLQIWDAQQQSWGRHEDWLSDIFYDFAPTPMWTPGEVYAQTRWVQVFDEIPPGGYRFALRVFVQPPQSMPFTLTPGLEGIGEWLMTARAFVGAPPQSESTSDSLLIDAELGEQIRLTSAELDAPLNTLAAGDTLNVTLHWEALTPPLDDYILFLHLLDANGQFLVGQDARPSDIYPTDTWNAGTHMTTTHTLLVPEDSVGPYTLAVGMYSHPSLERLTVVQGGVEMPNGLIVIR